MAAYEIVIRNEAASNESKSPIAGDNAQAQDTTPSVKSNVDNTIIAPWRKSTVKGLVIANTYIKPFVDRMVAQKVSTIALRTGAQEQEDRISFGLEIGEKAFGFIESVAIGALVGGGVPGAIIGGVMSLATTAIDYANKAERINLQRDVENIGLQFMNIRAGGSVASYSGSRNR